jgi:hypothetical protein
MAVNITSGLFRGRSTLPLIELFAGRAMAYIEMICCARKAMLYRRIHDPTPPLGPDSVTATAGMH